MALLFCDSFNYIDDGYENAKWDFFNPAWASFASGYGRRGDWGILITAFPNYIRKNLQANASTLIYGAAYNIETFNATYGIFRFYDSGSIQIEVRPYLDGSLNVYRGTTLIGSSSAGVVSTETWFYMEVKATFHNTTGSVEVKVNGITVVNLTSQDTSTSGNEYANGFSINAPFSDTYIDDLYLCDTLGGINDDFLGDIKITPLYPTSDGNSSDFTRSAGSTNYENVDEPQLVGEADSNYSSTIGHKDLYGITTYSGSGTILGVQVNAIVKNNETGAMKLRALSRSGAVLQDNEGSDYSLSPDIKNMFHIWDQEPTDSVAWTDTKINAAEFGIKIQS